MKRRLTVTAIALLALAVPLSCSSSDSKSSTTTTKAQAETSTTTAAPTAGGGAASPAAAPAKVDPVPTLKNPVGIIKDVKLTSCDTKAGPVTAKGTVTNSGTTPADVAITVGWTGKTGNTVNARAVVVLKAVAPAAQKDWSVTSTVTSTDPVQCVLGAQRGDPQG